MSFRQISYESSHQALHYLQMYLHWSVGMKGLMRVRTAKVHIKQPNQRSTQILFLLLLLQSNLVVSNSLISNYRLSRSENLGLVLTWNYDK